MKFTYARSHLSHSGSGTDVRHVYMVKCPTPVFYENFYDEVL